jgi:hypothetical protein
MIANVENERPALSQHEMESVRCQDWENQKNLAVYIPRLTVENKEKVTVSKL